MTSAQPPFVRKIHTWGGCPSQDFTSQVWAVVHLTAALCMQLSSWGGGGTQWSCAVGVSSHLFKCPYFLLDSGNFKQKKGILRTNILKIKTVFLFHILKFSSIKADCGLSSILLNEGYCSFQFSVECYRDFAQPFTISGERNCILTSEMMQPESWQIETSLYQRDTLWHRELSILGERGPWLVIPPSLGQWLLFL